MKSHFLNAAVAGAMALFGLCAQAHDGPRVWIGNEGGKIITYTSNNDFDPTVYSRSRLFAATFDDLSGIAYTEFPGFEVRRDGGNVSLETTFGFGIGGPLMAYDSARRRYLPVSQRYASQQNKPQVAVAFESEVRITSSAAQTGFEFFTFFGVGDHSHLSYILLGDGVSPNVSTPANVFAVPLTLTSSTLGTSDLFYVLLGKDVAVGSQLFDQAYLDAQSLINPVVAGPFDLKPNKVKLDNLRTLPKTLTAIPEPAVSVGFLGVICLLARPRHRGLLRRAS